MNHSSVMKHHRQLEGAVASRGGTHTVVVEVHRLRVHSKYGKQYQVSKRYAVDCRDASVKVGDWVKFEECRPLSKTKRWRFIAKAQTRA